MYSSGSKLTATGEEKGESPMKRVRILGCMATALICTLLVFSASASVLRIPENTKEIEDEAFLGDMSLDEVVIPDGVERIGERAFAESGLTKINLPSSLKSIADNAIDPRTDIEVAAQKGTVAYDWAVDKGFIDPEPGNVPAILGYEQLSDTTVRLSFNKVSSFSYWRLVISSQRDYADAEWVDYIENSVTDGQYELKGLLYRTYYVWLEVFDQADNWKLKTSKVCKISLTSKETSRPSKLNVQESFRQGTNGVPYYVLAWEPVERALGYLVYIDYPGGGKEIEPLDTDETQYSFAVGDPYGLYYQGCKAAVSAINGAGETKSEEFLVRNKLEPSPVTGFFAENRIILGENDTVQLSGTVTASGKEIEKIGIAVGDQDGIFIDYYALKDFTEEHVKRVSLEDWPEFSLTTPDEMLVTGVQVGLFASTADGATTFLGSAPVEVRNLDIEFMEKDDYIIITGTKQQGGTLSIPYQINGKPVKEIADDAFQGRDDLTGELILPDSIERIGHGAFCYCTGFTRLELPQRVKEIGKSAFCYCTGFSGSLTVPSSARRIMHNAFGHCTGLTGLVFRNGIENIEEAAFAGCTGLEGEIVIPGSVLVIQDGAFAQCSVILKDAEGREISVPYNATAGAALENIEWEQVGDGVRIIKYTHTGGNIIIPESINGLPVTIIGEKAYAYLKHFEDDPVHDILIPDTVEIIEERAFWDGFAFKGGRLRLGKNLKSIGTDAFRDIGLKGSLVIPDSVVTIGSMAFRNNSFTSVKIGSGLTRLSNYVFDMNEFRYIEVPENICYLEAQWVDMKNDLIIDIRGLNVECDFYAFYMDDGFPKVFLRQGSKLIQYFEENLFPFSTGMYTEINYSSITTEVGKEFVLSVGVKCTGDIQIQWKSSDPSVAGISDGLVHALKEGTATITADVTIGNETGKASCAVTVKGTEEPSVRVLSVTEINYRFQKPLDFQNDAMVLHHLLMKATPGGYPVTAEYHYQDLGIAALHDKITHMANLANENDYTVVLLGCHGGSGIRPGSQYEGTLVLTDGQNEENLTLRAFIEDLNRIPGKVVLMLSSCGSGSVIKAVESVDTGNKFTVLTSTTAGVDAQLDETMYDEIRYWASGYLIILESAIAQMTGDAMTDRQIMSIFESYAETAYPNKPQVYPINGSVIFTKGTGQ